MSGQQGLGYWGVLDHVRSWSTFDGRIAARMAGTNLDGYSVAAIAIEYRLMQTLPQRGGFAQFGRVAELVNSATTQITKGMSLTAKCGIAIDLAKAIAADAEIKRNPYSAASKLLWFVKPHHWTMFDRHAFNAMFARNGPNRECDMNSFYGKLQDDGFDNICEHLAGIARDRNIPLVPERVVDKVLMLRGCFARPASRPFGKHIITLCSQHGLADQRDLNDAAKEIDQYLSDKFIAERSHGKS